MRAPRRAGRRVRAALTALTAPVDRATLAIRVACSGPVDLPTLRALEAALDAHPGAIDLQFARACLLEDLGRLPAARRAYAAVLAREPRHAGALTNAATLAFTGGRATEALALYRRARDAAPGDAAMHVNLANLLAANGAWDEARASYERALALEPGHAVAHYALALLLAERDDESARVHRARAFAEPIVHVRRATAPQPLRILVPYAADGGNLVTTLFFDERAVETIALAAESYARDTVLPPHDAIVNAVADADRSPAALTAVERIVAASGRPCINPPATVRATGRSDVAARIADIPGVVAPRTRAFARTACTPAALAAAGFTFPLLLRTPGFHAGAYFVRVAHAAELAPQLDALPGDTVLAIAFIDTRDAAGRFCKYRMLIVDGRLVPLHVAFSRHWNVHYFSADNAVRAASRDAERAWLADPRGGLGERAYAALEGIRDALALDYGGIDFALDASGDVVVFEANASFAIYLPDDDATAAYRLPAATTAIAAVRAMIRERALRGGQTVREHGALDHREDLRPA